MYNILSSFKRAIKSHNKAVLILFGSFLKEDGQKSAIPLKEWPLWQN